MNTSSQPIDDDAVFAARITDQMLTKNRDGQLQVILTVTLVARLMNAKNPAKGTQDCEPAEQEVWMTIVPDDDDRLRMTLRDLERLGFMDNDLSRLHPEHPECFSLIEKDVYVRCKSVGDRSYWNLAWPAHRAMPVPLADLRQSTTSLQAKVAEARARMQGEKQPRVSSPASPPVPPQPDVGY